MEKPGKSYRSVGILGKIYDSVTALHFDPEHGNFDRRVLDAFEYDGDTLAKVRQLKSEYDQALRSLMAQRGISTEFEFWTGFALTKPIIGSQYKLQEDLGREGTSLKMRFRDSIKNMAGGATFDALAPYVAAMYKVNEEEVRTVLARDEKEKEEDGALDARRDGVRLTPLISFPWIYYWVLGRIATQRGKASDVALSGDGVMASKTCNASGEGSGQEQKLGLETAGSGIASVTRPRRQDSSADSVSGSVSRAATSTDASTDTSDIEIIKIEDESAQDRLLDLFD